MVAPFVIIAAGVAARIAAKYAAKKLGQYAAKKAAQKAVQKMVQNAMDKGKKKLQEAVKKRCKTGKCKPSKELCKELFGSKTAQKGKYRGGAYSKLGAKKFKIERHHIPPKGIGYPPKDGPSIQMDYKDHQKTSSWGNSNIGIGWREAQKKTVGTGKFLAAMALEVFDIKSQFGGKYDAAIGEAIAYYGCLKAAEKKGKK